MVDQGTTTLSVVHTSGSREEEEALLKIVRTELRRFEKATKGKNWSNRQRLAAATTIQRELLRSRKSASSSVQLLVQWVLDMLRERSAAGKMLRTSSIRTYISLLAPAFLDHGRDIQLLDADEDEIEEFYFKVLNRPVDEVQRRFAHDGAGRRLDEWVVLGRLREFHRFLEKTYAVENPDWSALGEDLTSSQVSAHIVAPDEYEIRQHKLLRRDRSEDFGRTPAGRQPFQRRASCDVSIGCSPGRVWETGVTMLQHSQRNT